MPRRKGTKSRPYRTRKARKRIGHQRRSRDAFLEKNNDRS